MRDFAALYVALDRTTSTTAKVSALRGYFETAAPGDAAWALHVLLGNRPKRLVGPARLREWVTQATGLAPWLIEECYAQVGDLAETVALLVPGTEDATELGSLQGWIEERLLALAGQPIDRQRELVQAAWRALPTPERFVWTKLLTGAFRVGVAQGLVLRAVAEATGREVATIAHRVMGTWQPSAEAWTQLIATEEASGDPSRPYPFGLAGTLEDAAELGAMADWQIEWKWDGIRAQLIRRAGRTIDAVLVAAQAGHGRRAGLYTDYTFAVRDGERFVTFAKAYSGLTDAELRQVDAFVRQHTRERHGPVRVVEPRLVFELAFEGVHRSTRHKSGVAVRFPRIARWRTDKSPADIDTLATLQAMADGNA